MYLARQFRLLHLLTDSHTVCHMATTSTLNGEIAARVRGAADALGVTQRDLALNVGIADRTFARLLAGQADWKVTDLDRIADVLALDVYDLIPRAA